MVLSAEEDSANSRVCAGHAMGAGEVEAARAFSAGTFLSSVFARCFQVCGRTLRE